MNTGPKPYTKLQFIDKANCIHNNFYNYSKSNYKKSKEKIVIICPIHGEFIQKPSDHLIGKGCKSCGISKMKYKKTNIKQDFVNTATKIHNKYNYSKFIYINNHTKGIIICPIHGEFEQTPCSHLKGFGCKLCGYEKNRISLLNNWKNPTIRKKLLNPEVKKNRLDVLNSKEYKQNMSIIIKNRWQNPEYIKHMSDIFNNKEYKQNKSNQSKKLWKNPEYRKKIISTSKWNNVKCDKGQLELLEKWNKLGFNLKPNYQIKDENNLFYVDGYDPIHNIAIEYDSKYHFTLKQQEKDLIRQNKIINILKPKKFWRYNSVNKIWRNVL